MRELQATGKAKELCQTEQNKIKFPKPRLFPLNSHVLCKNVNLKIRQSFYYCRRWGVGGSPAFPYAIFKLWNAPLQRVFHNSGAVLLYNTHAETSVHTYWSTMGASSSHEPYCNPTYCQSDCIGVPLCVNQLLESGTQNTANNNARQGGQALAKSF